MPTATRGAAVASPAARTSDSPWPSSTTSATDTCGCGSRPVTARAGPGRWPAWRSSSARRCCSPTWMRRWVRSPRLDTVGSIRGRLNVAIFARVAGPQGAMHRDRIHGTPGPRWFEPGSPITRVHGDASMYVGGLRAVLLQTLQPAAMTAVAEHSGYRGDIWGRLARTSRFLAVTTFGTAEHAQQAVDVVRAIHDRVVGTMPDGTPYAATDPHLLEWVHIAEVHSFLLAYQHYAEHPLDQAERDEYVAQTAFVARQLGAVDPPTTEAELEEALARFRPELTVTDHAREAVSYLIWHPDLPIPARFPYGVLVAAAIGLMPPWSRRPLGLPRIPLVHDRTAGPLGLLATRTIRWAMTSDPSVVARLEAQRSRSVTGRGATGA